MHNADIVESWRFGEFFWCISEAFVSAVCCFVLVACTLRSHECVDLSLSVFFAKVSFLLLLFASCGSALTLHFYFSICENHSLSLKTVASRFNIYSFNSIFLTSYAVVTSVFFNLTSNCSLDTSTYSKSN